MRKNRKTFHFEIRCIEAKGKDIQEMVDQAQSITYRTFFKNVPLEEVLSLFPGIYNKHGNLYQNYFTIKRDWAVQYFKSRYQNRRCYYLTQSGIEYIFTEGDGRARRLKGVYRQSKDRRGFNPEDLSSKEVFKNGLHSRIERPVIIHA